MFKRESERAQVGLRASEGEEKGEGEADFMLSQEPCMGLDPMTLGS